MNSRANRKRLPKEDVHTVSKKVKRVHSIRIINTEFEDQESEITYIDMKDLIPDPQLIGECSSVVWDWFKRNIPGALNEPKPGISIVRDKVELSNVYFPLAHTVLTQRRLAYLLGDNQVSGDKEVMLNERQYYVLNFIEAYGGEYDLTGEEIQQLVMGYCRKRMPEIHGL